MKNTLIMKVPDESNNLQLHVKIMNGCVKMGSVFRTIIGVMVANRIAMMDQMKTIVVSKNVQIKSLHDYQSFFM